MSLQTTNPGERVALDLGKRRAVLLMDGKRIGAFDIEREDILTETRAEDLLTAEVGNRLVVFERSSPQARELLRRHGLSYAAADGELFVHAPPIHVERPPRQAIVPAPAPAAPFAIRSSRVPRRLLLHADEHPTIRELAELVKLSEAMVSRTARALADDGLVAIESDSADARRRRVRLRDPRALLDAFERAIAGRRPRRVTWDIGARDTPEALDRLRTTAKHLSLPYTVSGLAGAAFVRRVVEPAEVNIWISRDDPQRWAEELLAAPARPRPGRVTAFLASDPFVLSLASSYDHVHVADPVQLYLDCRGLGERALEAAEAIRDEMNW